MKNTTGITICKSSECPKDMMQYRPENGRSKSYKTVSRAMAVCSKLLNNPRSGWTVGESFQGFFIVSENAYPDGHEKNGIITLWFN